MPKTWFTADTHFRHANIIRHCSRPFADVSEMDRTLVDSWNAVVSPGDDVWVLGDFAIGGPEIARGYLRRLRGKKHLVWGNHDKHSVRQLPDWASSQAYVETKVDDVRLVLLHYALRTWPGSNHGVLHLYGHSHGNLPVLDDRSLDVGVDVWGFRPVSLTEIRKRLATQPSRVCGHV